MTNKFIKSSATPQLLLQLGLAFVFLYAAIAALAHPLEWLGYVPNVATKFVSATLALKLIAVYEIVLAAWLLRGKFLRYAALLAALTFAGIILGNLGQMIVTFRDVGLLFAALALFFTVS